MSYASAGAARGLAEGLGNIGRLLMEQKDRQRELERQAAEDQRLAMDRARAEAEFLDRTGVAFVPAQAPDITREFTPPRFGAGLPTTREPGGIAAPLRGYLSGVEGPAPSPFANIGRAALGAHPLPEIQGIEGRFQPGGFMRVGPSAADRASLEAARVAGVAGPAMVRSRGLSGAFTPQEETLIGAGKVDLPPRPPERLDETTQRGAYDQLKALRAQQGQETPAYQPGINYASTLSALLSAQSTSVVPGRAAPLRPEDVVENMRQRRQQLTDQRGPGGVLPRYTAEQADEVVRREFPNASQDQYRSAGIGVTAVSTPVPSPSPSGQPVDEEARRQRLQDALRRAAGQP